MFSRGGEMLFNIAILLINVGTGKLPVYKFLVPNDVYSSKNHNRVLA